MTEFTRLYEFSTEENRETLLEEFEPTAELRAWFDKFSFFAEGEPEKKEPAVFRRWLNGITSESDDDAVCGLVAVNGSGGRYMILEGDFPALMYQTTANELYAPLAKGDLDCLRVSIRYYDGKHKYWITKAMILVWYKGDLYELN